jgi:hypothetical protein
VAYAVSNAPPSSALRVSTELSHSRLLRL